MLIDTSSHTRIYIGMWPSGSHLRMWPRFKSHHLSRRWLLNNVNLDDDPSMQLWWKVPKNYATVWPKLCGEFGWVKLFGNHQWLCLHDVKSHCDQEFRHTGLVKLLIMLHWVLSHKLFFNLILGRALWYNGYFLGMRNCWAKFEFQHFCSFQLCIDFTQL